MRTEPALGSGARPTRSGAGLDVEGELLARFGPALVALDEVGRGALAGPVSVGALRLVRLTPPPPGVADSKLLSPSARARLVPALATWCDGYAIGHSSAAEIDELGIMGALRLAGERALVALEGHGEPAQVVLLDGNFDWLSRAPRAERSPLQGDAPPVVLRVKADRDCAAVAGASILAKVERDSLLAQLGESLPGYGFERHKGYGSPEHLRAIERLGPSGEHRRSWRLPPSLPPSS